MIRNLSFIDILFFFNLELPIYLALAIFQRLRDDMTTTLKYFVTISQTGLNQLVLKENEQSDS